MANKRIFVVADLDQNFANQVANILRASFDAIVYVATDGQDALGKIRNAPPSLFVASMELGTQITLADIVRIATKEPALQKMPILVFSDIPENTQLFTSEVTRARMKFLSMPLQENELVEITTAALASAGGTEFTFKTIQLKLGNVLFKEGEESKGAYLLKTGKLAVSRKENGKNVFLGEVKPGEFVGEMAHITGEPRSADVTASEDSELVEIPCGTLDLLIFSKPTWTKALLKTFANRLRAANQKTL